MRHTHFHPKVENDSLLNSFSTNEIIKANSVKCYTPPLKHTFHLITICLHIKSSVSQRKHKEDERKGGRLLCLGCSLYTKALTIVRL